MIYSTRFLLTFTLLCALIGLSTLIGATPSLWTVGIIITASLAIAAMTAPASIELMNITDEETK